VASLSFTARRSELNRLSRGLRNAVHYLTRVVHLRIASLLSIQSDRETWLVDVAATTPPWAGANAKTDEDRDETRSHPASPTNS